MTSLKTMISSESRRIARNAMRLAFSLTACALLASCAALSPGFRSPVPPFVTPPATTVELANHMARYQPPVTSFNVRLDVVARGGEVKGKDKFSLRMLYHAPDSMLIDADAGTFIGGVLRMTQNNGEVAVYFTKQGQYFRGTLAELDAYPRALKGMRPADLVRALLVGQEAADQLRKMPAGRSLQSTPDSWTFGVSSPGRAESYRLRRTDGLVEEMDVFDASSALKARIVYSRYAMFGGVLLPSRFDLYLPGTGLHLTAKLEKASPNIEIPDARFSLIPPGQLQARPLSEYLEQLEIQTRMNEAQRQTPNAR